MSPNSIPIRLTIAEICLAALMEAADGIEAAHDTAAFQAALDSNHRLWLAMRALGERDGGAVPSFRDSEFSILESSRLGVGVTDATIETLVAINRRMANALGANGDIPRIRTRVRLAYRESCGGGLIPWLLAQMNRKDHLRSLFVPAAEHRAMDGSAPG